MMNNTKSKYISHIILEGVDGVGKTTLVKLLYEQLRGTFMVYDRGEISNYVYAKKFHRSFITLQRGLPILYILLVANKKEIEQHLLSRGNLDDYKNINDQDKFIEAAQLMQNDYHIIMFDVSGMSPFQAAEKLAFEVIHYHMQLISKNYDKELSPYNNMYKFGLVKSDKLKISAMPVIDNQPYFGAMPIMADAALHNGSYESFDCESLLPHNLIFCMAYSKQSYNIKNKTKDFCYIINSKIARRPEVNNYIKELNKNHLSVIKDIKFKVFGDDYIKYIAQARATVYTARELEYLKFMTCRVYESILADQIVFVDSMSDKNCDILKSIHKDKKLVDLLTVKENTISAKYKKIIKDKKLWNKILKNQKSWYYNKRKAISNEKD